MSIKISARAATPREAQQLADAWVAALARQVQAVENPTGKAEQALRIVPIESAALPDRRRSRPTPSATSRSASCSG